MVQVPTQRAASGTEAEPSLSTLRELRNSVRTLYRREAASICDYVAEQGDRTVVGREVVAYNSVDGLPADPTQHAISASFVVAHLASPSRLCDVPLGVPMFESQYLGARTEVVTETVLRDLVSLYQEAGRTALSSSDLRAVKDTWHLPNWFSTPVHLSAVAAAVRGRGGAGNAAVDILALGDNLAEIIAGWLAVRGGFVPDVGKDDISHNPQLRNPYLTYWCVRSLVDWANLVAVPLSVEAALRSALEANLDFMARILVANEAGIGSTYDAPDLVCSISVVALASRYLHQRDEYVTAVLPHAVDLLLETYVHRDGSFAPNGPVLEASGSRGIITVSSEELNAILVHALRHDLLPGQLLRLQPAVDHADRKSSGPRGWGESAGLSPDRRTVFVAAGALAFLRGYRDALDSSIARMCAQELAVQAPVWDMALDAFTFPHAIAQMIEDRVIKAIATGGRNLAITTLVLSGPRRAPKDLIARKIAHELEWPIVVFDPASFVREGMSLESEVGRVLDLVNELSDTVVVLDRFDDTVAAFEQPSLRWSIFGRLGHICASQRILMVIDSTEPARIGLTADQSGHFVNVLTVDPPNDQERRAALERLFDRFDAESDVRIAFAEAAIVEHTHGFTEGFLHDLVRACVALKRSTGTIDADAVERERLLMVQRLDTEELRPHDRP